MDIRKYVVDKNGQTLASRPVSFELPHRFVSAHSKEELELYDAMKRNNTVEDVHEEDHRVRPTAVLADSQASVTLFDDIEQTQTQEVQLDDVEQTLEEEEAAPSASVVPIVDDIVASSSGALSATVTLSPRVSSSLATAGGDGGGDALEAAIGAKRKRVVELKCQLAMEEAQLAMLEARRPFVLR